MIGVSVTRPRRTSSCNAVNNFFFARSPVAPNNTSASLRMLFLLARDLHVASELLAHRREHLSHEQSRALRTEALVQRGRQHVRGHAGLHCSDRGPATFAGVGDAPAEVGELR